MEIFGIVLAIAAKIYVPILLLFQIIFNKNERIVKKTLIFFHIG